MDKGIFKGKQLDKNEWVCGTLINSREGKKYIVDSIFSVHEVDPGSVEFNVDIKSKKFVEVVKAAEGWRGFKITEPQRNYIDAIQSTLGVSFKGKTRGDAYDFISKYQEKYRSKCKKTHQNNHKSSTAPCYTDDDPYDTEDDIFYVHDFFPEELLF